MFIIKIEFLFIDKYSYYYHANMQRIIDGLTKTLNDDIKPTFSKLFTRVYLEKSLPPVVTYDDIKHELKYDHDANVFRTSTHIGQRKLFLSELQFITNNINPDEEVIVVYAGAAPSNKTGFLSELFPNIKWVLVDPNPFNIFNSRPKYIKKKSDPLMDLDESMEVFENIVKGSEKLNIINSIFTPDMAKAVEKFMPDCLFISDIRTNVYNEKQNPDALDILWNLSQQFNWMHTMKPRASIMKFRHPFYADDPAIFLEKSKESPVKDDFEISKELGVDFVKNYDKKELQFYNGTIYLQCWQGHSSTETRIVVDKKHIVDNDIKDYGTADEFDNKFFYFNSIERCYGKHVNPNTNKRLAFDNCNDCALENLIWENYIKAYGGKDVLFYVKKLSDLTRRHLNRENHGKFFGRYKTNVLINAIDKYNKDPRSKNLL